MAKLTRVTGKIFGETASSSGNDPEIGQFGSAKAGTYNGTGDVATIQGLSAWSNGWIDAVTPTHQFPTLPEMTGVHKVLSYQNAYLLQQGIAEWDSATTYYTNNFCAKNGKIYISQTDDNLNNDPESDTVNWHVFESGGARNIGEVVTSTMPLSDAGLHLLDGALLSGSGSYADFVDYIGDLYDSGDYTAIFTTEALWQSTVSGKGVCDKFVYDSVNNTVRLPKWGNQAYTKASSLSLASTVPVRGNGTTLGITDGTNNYGTGSGTTNWQLSLQASTYGTTVGTSLGNVGQYLGKTFGITTEGANSGIVADTSSVASLNQYPVNCYYYIVIATSTKTNIQVDIDEIATDLNGKADVHLTNVNAQGTSKSAGWAMPSGTYEDLTLGASGTSYTAPANGWFTISKVSGVTNAFLYLHNQSNLIINGGAVGTGTATSICGSVPVLKGQSVQVIYSATGNTDVFRFVYAKGSESEA